MRTGDLFPPQQAEVFRRSLTFGHFKHNVTVEVKNIYVFHMYAVYPLYTNTAYICILHPLHAILGTGLNNYIITSLHIE